MNDFDAHKNADVGLVSFQGSVSGAFTNIMKFSPLEAMNTSVY